MESYGSEVITTYILETWCYKIVQNIAEQAFLKEISDDYLQANTSHTRFSNSATFQLYNDVIALVAF